MSVYLFECIFQGIMLILSIVVYFVVMQHHKGVISNKLCLAIGYSLLVNLGYFLELTATNVDSAMMGVKVNYCGAAFVSTAIMMFIFEYCKVRVSNYIKAVLYSWNILICLCLWTYEYNELFYKDIRFITGDDYYYLVHGTGVLYIINIFVLATQMITSAVCAYMTYRKSRDLKYKKHCRILFYAMLIPLISYALNKLNLFGDFDFVPAAQAVTAFVMSMAVVYEKIFDSQRIGHEHVFGNIAEPVIIVDVDSKLVDANKQARSIFKEIEFLQEFEYIPEDFFCELLAADEHGEMEVSGEIFSVEKQNIVVNNDLQGYAFVFFNLTNERKQLETMRQLKAEADVANQAKSEFLTKMSHEIRTPINAVSGMNEMILRESTEPEIKKYAIDIKEAAATLLNIINEILDSSKIESGKMSIVPVEYEMSKMLNNLYSMCKIKAEEKGLLLKFEVDSELPSRYWGDDVRIKQILINIIGNSIKYTQKGSVTLRLHGLVQGDKARLKFEVIDTGIGIKEEEKAKLFERFQRIDEARNRNVEGTGLGMYITLQLLQLMDSKLEVESEYNHGSNFYFELEQKIVDVKPIGDYTQKTESAVESDKKEKFVVIPNAQILVVDDNKVNLRVMAGLLKRTQAKVTLAESGQKCLEILKQQSFDIIFLDHMMPEMDGIETLQVIQKQKLCEKTPIIALTANAIAGAKESYLEAGFWDFMAKPINMAELESILEKYLEI